ncbi:MAG TPA: ATP-binding cassette domain-containing protein [Gemmatimonadales bacterium]|nr:ATP-binding cassette domain-containing protein [Gemmatimonadales bacterium]
MTGPALQLRNIHKRYGTTNALSGAALAVEWGEIHALLGENGAGKSTLLRIAGGLERADRGSIEVDGSPATIRSPRDARRLGIGMVHQHPTSIPSLTVADNMALTAGWPVRPAEVRERVARLSGELGLPIDPDAYAGRLPVVLKQRLEILKALAASARILLLDEPTAVLAPIEAAELLTVLRKFAAAGNAVVIVTHKLREAISESQRVTVLRHGSVTFTGRSDSESSESLYRAMLGSDAAVAPAPARRIPPADSAPAIRVQALDVARDGRYGIALRGAALAVFPGEIVGIAAIEGSGQRELMRAVAGLVHPLRGVLDVRSPVAFIPEDRTTEGLIPSLSLAENVVLGMGAAAPGVNGALVSWKHVAAGTADLVDRFGIVAAGPDAPAGSLSGGNQQKLVLARALAGVPPVIVAENPTRGLDVAAAAEIHRRLRAAADGGAAVLFHSSDLDEVVLVADRLVVVNGGTLREPAERNRELIGRMMIGAA